MERTESEPLAGAGAYAGRPDGRAQLLSDLPEDPGLTVVVFQMFDSTRESDLKESLSKASRMPVSEVKSETRAEANHVYLIPPQCSAGIADGLIQIKSGGDIRPPSDHPEDGEIENLRKALAVETQRYAEAQRQVDRANAEFEDFISTAAHRLREPLRDVASFGQLMAEEYAGRLDLDANGYLERIQEGAETMQSVLTDVVDYWAMCTSDRRPSVTDMEAVLRRALLCTNKQIAQRSAVITHGTLPPVWGDFETLTKVLHHLIRNAVEYCTASTPRVHISSGRVDLGWVFSVQDNGPGIDPAFQCRVFEVFKRLHGKEHPGSGLGLAFCRKAVEWHGGRMWMESTPGAGSTFYFSLPPAN